MRFNSETRLEKTPVAEPYRLAVMRDPLYYAIVTEDNPDMVETINEIKKRAQEAFAALADQSQGYEAFFKEFMDQEQEKLKQRAIAQHATLKQALKARGIPVFVMHPEKGHLFDGRYGHNTDEVFATDTGLFWFDEELRFMPANFHNQQRKGEDRLAAQQAENALQARSIYLADPKTGARVEMEGGDIRQAPGRKLFFVGYGHRNSSAVPALIEKHSGYPVVAIELMQPKYYHLDCCFLPLPNDTAIIYEGEYERDAAGQLVMEASDPNNPGSQLWPRIVPGTGTMTLAGRTAIRQLYDNDHLILITEHEAATFGTNAALLRGEDDKDYLFVNHKSLLPETAAAIEAKSGVKIVGVPYEMMHMSGGSVRCTINEVPCSKEKLAQILRGPAADNSHHNRFFREHRVTSEDTLALRNKPW